MRTDPDFSAYVAARWVPVIRVLVLLGVPVERAEEGAVAAFARLLPDWGRLRRELDVDVELARTVLDGWVRTGGRQPAPRVPVPVPGTRLMTRELEDQLALLERLVDGLERLDESIRVTVVLRHFGELDEDQIADVLGEAPSKVHQRLAEGAATLDLMPLDQACHSAATALDVPPPSVGRVVAKVDAERRRRWWVSGAVAGALVVVAAVSYAVTRPAPSDNPAALEVTPVENPMDVAWWLDGTLHLDHGTARVADISQLVETGVGVAYADSDGTVTAVDEDGTRTPLGTVDPDTPMVAQPDVGLVAWLEPDRGDLVIYDVITDREVGRLDTTIDTRLIGWDRERLYFHRNGNDWSVSVDRAAQAGAPVLVDPPEGSHASVLLDVSSGAELRSDDGALSVVQPFFSLTRYVPGTRGQLSPDGNYVLTHFGDGRPAVYDSRSGEPQGTFFKEGWTPLAAAFTGEGRIVWVVESPPGSVGLYECQSSPDYINSFDPGAEPCTPPVNVGEPPVLAGTAPGLSAD